MVHASTLLDIEFGSFSYDVKPYRNLRRNIDIANGQEDHIRKSFKRSKSTGQIFDQPNDSVQSFCFRIGQSALDKRQDSMDVFPQGMDKFPDRFKAAFQGGSRPIFQKPLCGPGGLIVPELFEFILEHPGSMDSAVALFQEVQNAGIPFGALEECLKRSQRSSFRAFF